MTAAHDPYSRYDRFPQGACPAGSVVWLRVVSSQPLSAAFVRLWRGGGEERLPMKAAGGNAYEANVPIGNDTGLVWYYFILKTEENETLFLGKPDNGRCAVYGYEPPSFQITVYDPAFDTPHWMRSSVMMQIMTDRFCVGRDGAVPPQGRGAYLHKSWREAPDLCKNGDDEEAVDFFGGNLNGIREKLDFIRDMGIGAIYLNPIFKARSNHKYDTGDFITIDPSFGTSAQFRALCREASEKGIRVVLDGVFSHTGADSLYFNKYGTYRSRGAYNAYPDSPYSSWYQFLGSRDDYDCWWGIDTLPAVNEMDPSYLEFIVTGENSVCAHYLNDGASGWRLDVADELPMEFIRALRRRAKRLNADNCVIGEVWEDITNKLSYGRPRCYATGDTLDSAMNYPLRKAVLDFMLGETDAHALENLILHQHITLPKPMLYSMMNLLGSHDKPRVISILAGKKDLEPPREKRRVQTLTKPEYELGKQRFVRAFEFICHLPGMPCLYYGDDAGLTGMGDPFCRGTYPWGKEDKELQAEIRRIIRTRNQEPALRTGECMVRALDEDRLEVLRRQDGRTLEFILDRRI